MSLVSASELRENKRVRGLRSYTMGGPVTVKDAATGNIKRVIAHPPTYEEILDMPGATRKRIHTKGKVK